MEAGRAVSLLLDTMSRSRSTSWPSVAGNEVK